VQGPGECDSSLDNAGRAIVGRSLRGATAGAAAAGQQLPHNSVEDAAASMALVQEELRRMASGQGPTPPLQPPEVKVGHSLQLDYVQQELLPSAVTYIS